MNVQLDIEAPIKGAMAMMRWCRENRLPIIHHWQEPGLNVDGEHYTDEQLSCGSRKLFGMWCPADSNNNLDEEICLTFYVRERDHALWLLRFS